MFCLIPSSPRYKTGQFFNMRSSFPLATMCLAKPGNVRGKTLYSIQKVHCFLKKINKKFDYLRAALPGKLFHPPSMHVIRH